ncbi:hypothetical protein [uncultured Oscillibacter sp.]|uniref:hypothetical protein n=1 Tax=uncultured Oscillibacter sp. TaxID=876091 RepID=UPI0025F3B744|nr:hypothetical protein [uncultured Oscillibacter sp.]
MSLAVYEWRKLFRLPALWVFLGLSLLFNAFLICTLSEWDRTFFNETSADAACLGQRVDQAFCDGLEAMPETENRAALLQSVTGLEDIFETYDTGSLKDFYTDVVKTSPTAVSWMAWKYDLLAKRVDHLARTDAGMDLYAGPVTQGSHQFLFGTLMRAMLGEAAMAAMLGTLYLLGYEELHKTESLACASRTGRRLGRTKVLSSLVAAPTFLALVAGPSLGLYFARFDYGGIWGASVSSQFNYLSDMLLVRPFLTWGDFTVAGYLAAALALGAALTAVFSLLAALCGALVRSPYLAALVLGIFCFGGLGFTSVLGNLKLWVGYEISCFQPTIVWLCCGGWFTELGLNAVLPWQETITVVLDLLLLGAGTALALRRFMRKDVMA